MGIYIKSTCFAVLHLQFIGLPINPLLFLYMALRDKQMHNNVAEPDLETAQVAGVRRKAGSVPDRPSQALPAPHRASVQQGTEETVLGTRSVITANSVPVTDI